MALLSLSTAGESIFRIDFQICQIQQRTPAVTKDVPKQDAEHLTHHSTKDLTKELTKASIKDLAKDLRKK